MKDVSEIEAPLAKKAEAFLRKRKRSARRFSPFLWLSVFLFFFFLYLIITNTGPQTQVILSPFIAANLTYADFVLWSYFQGKKKYIILIIEGLISAAILYLFL